MTVADARGRRFDAAAGLVFVVLALVGFALPGTPPTADDSPSEIAKFAVDKRDEILTGNFLLGLAVLAFLWFLGALRSYLRAAEGGEGRLSAAAFGAGVAGSTLLLGGAAVLNGLAFEVAKSGDANLVRALFDVFNSFFALGGFTFAAFFAAASCSAARSGSLPPWAYWSGSVIALLQVLGGLALIADSGIFAAGDVWAAFVAPLTALAWTAAVSVLIFRRNGVPPVARAEP